MAENSKIEWCSHTFNPWIGCTKISPGCAHCYAEVSTPVRTARAKGRELWGNGAERHRTSDANWKKVRQWDRDSADGLEEAALWDKNIGRPMVFCASLADWLDDEVPIEWLADLLKLIHDTPNLDWLLLTKRPENWAVRLMEAFRTEEGPTDFWQWAVSWIQGVPPNNVWIGTTVEDQKRADERIPELLKIPAKVRFLSVEPQLEAIDLKLTRYIPWAEAGGVDDCEHGYGAGVPCQKCKPNVDWVINGFESGPKKRAGDLAWMRSIRDQCRAAHVRYFCKQVDKVQPVPSDLMIREFPV